MSEDYRDAKFGDVFQLRKTTGYVDPPKMFLGWSTSSAAVEYEWAGLVLVSHPFYGPNAGNWRAITATESDRRTLVWKRISE